MAEYKDIFSPKTLAGLKSQSKDTLAKALKGRQARQMLDNARYLIDKLKQVEAKHKQELERLAVDLAKEMYPVIDYAGIGIDAKLGSDTTLGTKYETDPRLAKKHDIIIHARGAIFPILMHEIAKGLYEVISKQAYHTKVSPEKRRIINSITQGGAIQGTFVYKMYKDYLDLIDPELVKDYTEVMDATFGGYHDENHIARLMQIIDQYGDKLTGVGRMNVSFPKRKEKGSEEAKKVTQQVDTYKNELDDLRYGRYIYNSITNLWTNSEFSDPRVRDLFLAELYKLEDYEEFRSFVENAINNELTSEQKKWALGEMRNINDDLKKEDTGLEDLDEIKRMQKLAGIKEIKVNEPHNIDVLLYKFIKDSKYKHEIKVLGDSETLEIEPNTPQEKELFTKLVSKNYDMYNPYTFNINGVEYYIYYVLKNPNDPNFIKHDRIVIELK